MPHTDLVLLRAPSIYDSRELILLRPPDIGIEFFNPNESYACSFLAALGELERACRRARVIDLSRRVRARRFDLDSFISKLDAPLFIVEASGVERLPGTLQAVESIKKHHPDARVMLCGCAATAFEKELIEFAQVDGVMREALNARSALQLIEADTAAKSGKIEGLVWKEKRGRVRRNEMSVEAVSDQLDITECYRGAISQIKRYRDFSGAALVREFLRRPQVSIYKKLCASPPLLLDKKKTGETTAFREPEEVYRDITELWRYSAAPIRIRGDIRTPEAHFAERLLSLLQHRPAPNKLSFELGSPASAFFIQEIARAAPGFTLLMAPGSHDEEIRRGLGHAYSNKELEAAVGDALRARARGIEILFIAGLPEQSTASVEETVTYGEYLLRRFDGDRRLSLTLTPFSPPSGSAGFGGLEKYGFKPRSGSFSDYVNALSRPGWQNREEYQTQEMSPAQLAEATYTALIRLARLKKKYGQVTHRQAEELAENYARGLQMAEWLDGLSQHAHGDELDSFAAEIESINKFAGPNKTGGLPIISRPRNVAALWGAAFGKKSPAKSENRFSILE